MNVKRVLSWLLLGGCMVLLLLGALVKANHWWEEKTLRPPYTAITMCKQIERALAVRATDGDLPSPSDCLADLVAGNYVSSNSVIDPWGNRFEVRASTNKNLRVWSLGPDGVSLTSDDLNADSPAVRPHAHGGFGGM